MRGALLTLVWLACATCASAQDPLREIDSLVRVMVKDTALLLRVRDADRELPASARTAGSMRDRAVQGIAAGMILQGRVRVDDAVRVLDRSIDQLNGTPDERSLACAYYYRGRAELVRNNIAGAIVQFERALRIASRLDYPRLDGLLEDGIGRAYGELQDYEKYRMHMSRALDKAVTAEAQYSCLSALIEAEARVGAFEDAEAHILRLKAISDSTGIEPGGVDLSRGELSMARGDHEQAIEHLSQALAYYTPDKRSITYRAWTMSRLSKAYRLAGRPAEAVDMARNGLRLSEQHGLRKEVQDNEGELYRAYAALGDKAAAFDHLQRYLALQDSATGVVASGIVGTTVMRSELARQARADSLLRAERDMRLASEQRAERSRQNYIRNITLLGSAGLIILAIGLWSRLRFTRRSRAAIQKEKEISEGLLLNILPEEVARELKAKGSADARLMDEVTVLFTDFKGFTAMSEQVSPQQLVHDLNECFSAFDHICEGHRIEKIKTIGDAYMAAGGLPTPNATHAADVIHAVLEMRDFIAAGKSRKVAAGMPYFEIRIGVHTGPVVAGIVGVKKFQYDIWGDTVNIASRMESSGEVGQVNISEATHALVKNEPGLSFTPRGKVQAKGKGELEMYFVRRSSEGA